MENENDHQESNIDEQVGTENEIAPEVLELQQKLAEKEEQVKRLAIEKRELKRQVKDKTPEGLDYGQKAFLKTSGIDDAEFNFVEEQLRESNMSLDKLLTNSYFQAQLKEKRDTRAIEAAMPPGDARQNGTVRPQTQVDWWLNRGEMPPNTPENRDLRREVVNKRFDIEKNRSKFSSQGVVDNTG